MTTGERIRKYRKEQGLTQKALGELLGVSQATVGQYETNHNPPKIETLERIAVALQTPLTSLLDCSRSALPWDLALEQKLSHIGFSTGFDEDNAAIWINYPDGWLEVRDEQLKELNAAVDSFLRYKLAELKDEHISYFRKWVYKTHGDR